MTGARAIGLLLAAVLAAGTVRAQEAAAIRAVEHPEYSRLVLPVPPGASWTVARDGHVATVILSGTGGEFDLSAVFERMPRTRILAVAGRKTGNGAALDLTLACPCGVTVRRLGPQLLAVDVRRDTGGGAARAANAVLGPGTTPDTGGGDAGMPRQRTMPDPAGATPLESPAAAPGGVARDPLLVARESLMSQLERAAREGLVALAPAAETTLPSPEAPPISGGRGPEAVPGAETPVGRLPPPPLSPGRMPAPGLGPHIAVRTAADRPPPEPGPMEAVDDLCVDDEALDIASWGVETSDPFAEIGAIRRTIVGGTGAVVPEAVERLARAYVAIGFGREAAALLARAGDGVPDRALLRDIANLIEGRIAQAGGPIASAEGCAGRVRLWRAAAGLDRFDPATEQGAQIIEDLAEIPPRLRRMIGQEVAAQALRAGAPEAARAVFDLLERTPEPPMQAELRTRAEMALASGDAAGAAAMAAALISGASSPDPDLWLLRARAVLADGAEVPPQLAGALAVAARGLEGTPTGLDLTLARARLEARRGAPVVAMEVLRAAEARWAGARDRVRGVAREILFELDPGALAPAQTARVVMAGGFALGDDGESRRIRVKYARVLTAAGLPNLALEIAAPGPAAVPDSDTALVSATAQLASGAADAAISALAGQRGPEAARLRMDAFARRGAFASAYGEARALEDGLPGRARMALLSGNWREPGIAALDGDYRALGAYLATRATPGLEADPNAARADAAPDRAGPGTLVAARAALRAAEDLRAALPGDAPRSAGAE